MQDNEKKRLRRADCLRSSRRLFAKFSKGLRKEIKRFQPKKWEIDVDDHLRMIFLNLPDNIIKKIKCRFFLEIIKKVKKNEPLLIFHIWRRIYVTYSTNQHNKVV